MFNWEDSKRAFKILVAAFGFVTVYSVMRSKRHKEVS